MIVFWRTRCGNRATAADRIANALKTLTFVYGNGGGKAILKPKNAKKCQRQKEDFIKKRLKKYALSVILIPR